jgi:methyltransferase (TIGR00027 family)
MNQVISHVSDTAFMVAGFRALETERPDALFRDPLAAKLSGEHGRNILTTIPRGFVGAWSVVIRTVIIDAFIQEAVAGGVDTILNLGAGLDTRPYRMALPKSLRWIEVDYPHVIDLKHARLVDERPNCRLDRVKLDLTDRAARRQLFAEVNTGATRILVLSEGVIPYLTEGDVAALAADLKDMDRARCWVIDYFSPEALKFGRRMRARVLRNAPFRFQPKDWFGFFAGHGWQAKEIRYIAEEADRLNRPIPLPPLLRAWMVLRTAFASPTRRRAVKHFAGYVLLVPN